MSAPVAAMACWFMTPTLADGRGREQPRGPAHEEPPPEGLQLPVKKLASTRAWRLDEKPRVLQDQTAQAIAVKTARFRHRAASHRQTHFATLPSDTGPWPLPGCFAALRPPPRAQTQKQPHSLKSCRSDATPRARAPHIARARCGNAPPRAAASKSAYAQTSPRALQPTHTTKRAGPLPHEAGHHVQAETVATAPTPRAGVPRYSLRSSAKTRTTVIRAAGSV